MGARIWPRRLPSLLVILAVSVLFLSGCGTFSRPSGPGYQVVKTAESYLGTPYRYGGKDPSGFDCSGLTYFVYREYGYELPRSAGDQTSAGRWVSKGDLKAGDLVFFKTSEKGYHVGIYAGNGYFIHAPRTGKVVEYQSLDNRYYRKRYYTARRIIRGI